MLWPVVFAALYSQPSGGEPACLRDRVADAGTAFIDVAVIPMDRERVVAHRTVLVRGCVIERIAHRDSITVPSSYVRVRGGDNVYLLPGLVESHTHLRYDDDLALYLSRGVTTVRNMIGDSVHLRMKRAVRAGAFGPRIITAAPMPYANPDWPVGRIAPFVDSAVTAGYDFLKVQDGVTADGYDALVVAAQRRGVAVAGHIPRSVGLDGVLRAHQRTIEHAEQFVYRWFGENYDRSLIPVLAERARASGVAVTPTLAVIHTWIAVHDDKTSLLDRPEVIYLHPETFAFWNTFERTSSFDNRLIADFQNHIVDALQRAGVPLMAGTDAYQIGLMGGWGLLREIRALHAAGLSNFQALRSATATPAEVLGLGSGIVREGALADLILVDGNPLLDLETLSRLRGVMRDGEWYAAADLDDRLDRVARRYAAGLSFVRLVLAGRTMEALDAHRALRSRSDSSRLDAGTMAYVASIVRQRGRFDDAIRVYQLALEEDPRRASAHEGIARAHLGAGRIADARAALVRALEVDPQRQSSRDLLKSLDPTR